jgi:23S rRNA (cytidine2498-2'-O)-methyltransferase
MSETSRFIFVICQHGVESAAKKELCANHPELKFAFSRPGFLTFKIDAIAAWPVKFSLKSTLARTYGWSLGKVSGDDAQTLVQQVLSSPMFGSGVSESIIGVNEQKNSESVTNVNHSLTLFQHGDRPVTLRHLHVWERDTRMPGQKGFEPGPTVLANEIGDLFVGVLARAGFTTRLNRTTKADECVLDLVLVEPNEWWYGYHFATTTAGRWPGGVPDIRPEFGPISRAYFKAAEALEWSGIRIQPGEWCAEIGSAPGGCCQLLLEKGAKVIGIDPAEMDESLLESKRFVHIRRRGNEVRKKELADVKWLFADLNLVPNYTLDTVSDIVSHERVHIKGLVLTMKLADWKLLDKIPELRERVAKLGFQVVKTRQLAFNRQEFCLVAVRDKFALRYQKKKPVGKLMPRAKTTRDHTEIPPADSEIGNETEPRTGRRFPNKGSKSDRKKYVKKSQKAAKQQPRKKADS